MKHPTLSSTPITEALIDIRVSPQDGVEARVFEKLRATLEGDFPKMEKLLSRSASFTLHQKAAQATIQDTEFLGYVFKSADERDVAQFSVEGFTLNRLKPYEGWDGIFPKAMGLWQEYLCASTPKAVKRIAVRYINHIDLPSGPTELDNYLTAGPRIPEELPQHLLSFLTRVTIHDQEQEILAHVTQSLETRPTYTRILLDIDAFKQQELNVESPQIEGILLRLRVFKNEIFFSSLTEDAIKRYI